jgi:phosphatidylserine decarboxylase
MPSDAFPGPEKTPTALKPPSPGVGRFPKILKRPTLPAMLSSRSVSGQTSQQQSPVVPPVRESTPEPPAESAAGAQQARKRKFRRRARENGYQFNAENDIVGIVMVEILGAKDLPRLHNSALDLHTG